MAPPVFQEMKFNFNIDSGERGQMRQAGKMDINAKIDAELKRSGCGPFQVVYVMGLLVTWSIVAFSAYADKFMLSDPSAPTALDRMEALQNASKETEASKLTVQEKLAAGAAALKAAQNLVIPHADMFEELKLYEDQGWNESDTEWTEFTSTCGRNASTKVTAVVLEDMLEKATCAELDDHRTKRINKSVKTTLKYVQYIAWGVGIFCFGISEKIGMKPTLMGGLMMCSVGFSLWAVTGCLGLTGSTAIYWILFCKAIVFFAIGLIQFAGIYWPDEMLTSRNKTIMNLLPNVAWVMGALGAGYTWSVVRSWTAYLWIMAAAPAIFCSAFTFLDSPTTMYKRGRFSNLWASITGNKPAELTDQQRESDADIVFKEMRHANGVTDEIIGDDNIEQELDDADGEVADPDVEFDATFVKNLLIGMVCWFAAAVGFWGISNESTVVANEFKTHFVVSAAQLPGYVLAWFLASFIKDRRFTLSISAFGVAAMLGGASYAFQQGDLAKAESYNSAAQVFCSSLFGLVFVVIPGMFNGKRRDMATGILGCATRLGCVFSAYVGSSAVDIVKEGYMNFLVAGMNSTDPLKDANGGVIIKPGTTIPLTVQDLTDNATTEFLLGVPAAVCCVLVWFIPSGAGSWTWQKGFADLKGSMSNFSGGSMCSLFSGNWSYFVSGNRAITVVGAGLLFVFYAFGTGWAFKDYFVHQGVEAAIAAKVDETKAALIKLAEAATIKGAEALSTGTA